MKKNKKGKFRSDYPGDFFFDYKDPVTLYKFVMEGGKIVPSRISKVSNAQQREIASQVKIARNMALLPYGSTAYDNFSFPDTISPKPFEI